MSLDGENAFDSDSIKYLEKKGVIADSFSSWPNINFFTLQNNILSYEISTDIDTSSDTDDVYYKYYYTVKQEISKEEYDDIMQQYHYDDMTSISYNNMYSINGDNIETYLPIQTTNTTQPIITTNKEEDNPQNQVTVIAPDWAKAYAEYLNSDNFNDFGGSRENTYYSLAYLDNDDIPELIIGIKLDNYWEHHMFVIKYVDGELVKSFDRTGNNQYSRGWGLMRYNEKMNYIIFLQDDGSAPTNVYSIENGVIEFQFQVVTMGSMGDNGEDKYLRIDADGTEKYISTEEYSNILDTNKSIDIHDMTPVSDNNLESIIQISGYKAPTNNSNTTIGDSGKTSSDNSGKTTTITTSKNISSPATADRGITPVLALGSLLGLVMIASKNKHK